MVTKEKEKKIKKGRGTRTVRVLTFGQGFQGKPL